MIINKINLLFTNITSRNVLKLKKDNIISKKYKHDNH